VSVPQLRDLNYQDKLLDFAQANQSEPWTFTNSCDRIYLNSPAELHIEDPSWGRVIRIQSQHSQTSVVWNPGQEGVKTFTDIPDTDWPQYLCVEVANCGPQDRVELKPGDSCELSQTLSVIS
jgi:glucose-6-phosphate 1-epimerase